MFNYSIKSINGEKIVYLYIDYNCEFGLDLNSKNKNSNMKKEIKKYLKKNNLLRSGEKIALMFGGILLAVLLVVEEPKVADQLDLVYVTNSIIPKAEVVEVKKNNVIEEIKEDAIEEPKEEIKIEEKKPAKEIVNKKQEENRIVNKEIPKEEPVIEEIKEEEIEEDLKPCVVLKLIITK